jgi:hypothetical protein
MNRPARIALIFLLVWVALAIYWLQSVQQVTRIGSEPSEARARREVTQPPLPDPSIAPVKIRLYRITAGGVAIEPVEIEIGLSSDAAARARQLIAALAALDPPRGGERTLPPDTALLEFYLLPDGAAIADFSSELATAMPSGILSEQLALEAVTRTLAENLPQLRHLKIVIAGQEAETLAGHVDLRGFIELASPAEPGKAAPSEKSAANF